MTCEDVGMGCERWVFGYGSLMWRPGFHFAERQPAVLYGRRRAFCMYAWHHRGTRERPGLTLGLAPGGSVRGVAFRVREQNWPETLAYLRERELPTNAYVEALVNVRLKDARRVECLTYLSDMTHPQWAGDLPLVRQCELISSAHGLSGSNQEYLRDLADRLREENIRDRQIETLLAMTQSTTSASIDK